MYSDRRQKMGVEKRPPLRPNDVSLLGMSYSYRVHKKCLSFHVNVYFFFVRMRRFCTFKKLCLKKKVNKKANLLFLVLSK